MLTVVEWAAGKGRGHVPLHMAAFEQDSASRASSAGQKGKMKMPHPLLPVPRLDRTSDFHHKEKL